LTVVVGALAATLLGLKLVVAPLGIPVTVKLTALSPGGVTFRLYVAVPPRETEAEVDPLEAIAIANGRTD
jgi:hypothetical protein